MTSSDPLPRAESKTGLRVLRELARQRSLLPALEIMHADVGDIFQITLPSFDPAVVVGPDWNRYVLVSHRDKFLWRTERDPVTRLLRHGLLVEDGQSHDELRALMEPGLGRRHVNTQIEAMVRHTDAILAEWQDGRQVDMLVEMRRIALLILMGTLFRVDFRQDLDRMWRPILRAISYISPGLWVIWPGIPRGGYKRPLQDLDQYLYQIISSRRSSPGNLDDWLTHLIVNGLSDDLIRDQMLTMLIAGHDTSTALLAWTLYLLGRNPAALTMAQTEVDDIIGDQPPDVHSLGSLHYLDQVIKESLRLYPPIHVGNRKVDGPLDAYGYAFPANTRVMYSIYLSHRDATLWPEVNCFKPERFDRAQRPTQPPFTYVPFGGGPRNCIGAAFAQIEAKVVLARILQSFDLKLVSKKVRPYMGATLEPRPGVIMRVTRRRFPGD
ncbi:MAG: cytochrome P450 [Candidatus Promineifilaceae bacterium]